MTSRRSGDSSFVVPIFDFEANFDFEKRSQDGRYPMSSRSRASSCVGTPRRPRSVSSDLEAHVLRMSFLREQRSSSTPKSAQPTLAQERAAATKRAGHGTEVATSHDKGAEHSAPSLHRSRGSSSVSSSLASSRSSCTLRPARHIWSDLGSALRWSRSPNSRGRRAAHDQIPAKPARPPIRRHPPLVPSVLLDR